MDAEFWHERWRQSQIGFHQEEFNTHLQAFWGQMSLPRGSVVFVPLCGKSRDMLWLLSEGYEVLGIEVSPVAVADFFSENNLSPKITEMASFQCWETENIRLLCGDFFKLNAPHLKSVSGVYDRASLVALPPEMRLRYAQHFSSIIPAEARSLLVTTEYPQQEMKGPPFAVFEQEVEQLYIDHFNIDTLFDEDLLEMNPQFKKRGLTEFKERVYQLVPRG